MRIPIPWAILLCLIAVAAPAWLGIRSKDFVSPPGDAELEEIRAHARGSLPQLAATTDAISPQTNVPRIDASPMIIHLGNLAQSPQLNEYADRAPQGPSHLIELANRLEDQGHHARALLAWERVIDSAESSESEISSAIRAIIRLRTSGSQWNRGAESQPTIIIHAGTFKKSAETLEPVLRSAADDINRAAAGTLMATSNINAGTGGDLDDGPIPVAIWITGADGDTASTKVRSFTVATPETLGYDTHRTLYLLVREYLANSQKVRRPPNPPEEGDIREALTTHITRWQWSEFGRMLNNRPISQETN